MNKHHWAFLLNYTIYLVCEQCVRGARCSSEPAPTTISQGWHSQNQGELDSRDLKHQDCCRLSNLLVEFRCKLHCKPSRDFPPSRRQKRNRVLPPTVCLPSSFSVCFHEEGLLRNAHTCASASDPPPPHVLSSLSVCSHCFRKPLHPARFKPYSSCQKKLVIFPKS